MLDFNEELDQVSTMCRFGRRRKRIYIGKELEEIKKNKTELYKDQPDDQEI